MGALAVVPQAFAKVAAHEANRVAAFSNLRELDRSARWEDANAAAASYRGGLEAGALRERGTALQAAQRVGYAVGNIDSSSGTPAAVQTGTAMLAELDAQTARNNAIARALGHKEVSRRYRDQAQRLSDRYGPGGTADTELGLDLGLSALGAAFNLGTSALGGL